MTNQIRTRLRGEKSPPAVNIDFNDLASRLSEVPSPAGNYPAFKRPISGCAGWSAMKRTLEVALQCLDITNKGDGPDTVMADVKGYEISPDRKKMLISKGDDFLHLRFGCEGFGASMRK